MSCLAEQTIAQYVEAQLEVAAATQVEEHIDECADCRMAVAAAAHGRARTAPASTLASASVAGAPSAGPLPVLPPGTQVGRYVVRRVVGAGGMGLVYAAHDPKLDREVALKLLRPELTSFEDQRRLHERLLREAQLMARLTHPNVIAVHDVGVLEGQVFVTMELVVGETLRQKLRGEKRLTWREVLALFLAAGRGLSAAHREQVVHRDFKPERVPILEERTLAFPAASRAGRECRRVPAGPGRRALPPAQSGAHTIRSPEP